MKKILTFFLSILMLFSLTGCGSQSAASNGAPKQAAPDAEPKQTAATTAQNAKQSEKKILVAYFSHTETTQKVANQIHALTGGDIVAIKTETPYPTSYQACTELAKREKETNARPRLSTKIENIDRYDVIFVGYPIWWYSAPMPIYTLLESHDLSGKTVIPFCTSGGSDIAESLPAIKALCPHSTVLPGLTANNSNAIKPWLDELGLL